MAYRAPVPLGTEHDLEGFNSGEPTLDDWLAKYARQSHASGSARVFVVTEDDDPAVVGYYALAGASISRHEVTVRIAQGQPDPVPAVLLGRLAVDRRHQGLGLGRSLLRDALVRSTSAAADVGVRVFLVHAIHDEAKRFYMKYGFEESPLEELTLMMMMKDVRKTIQESAP